jgi:hypothetical protein
MPRYARQKKSSFNCGPVAILNCLKWAGAKVNVRQHLPYLEFAVRIHDNAEDPGTLDHDFDRVLRYSASKNLSVLRPKRLTLRALEKHLDQGGAVAVGYYFSGGGGHFTLLVGTKGRGFIAANDTRADKCRTLSYKRRATVAGWVKNQNNGFWLLEKKPPLTPSADNCEDGKATIESKTTKAKPPRL